MKISISIVFVLILVSCNVLVSYANDNESTSSIYAITDITAYGPSSASQSYSHTYIPNDKLKSGVQDYYNMKSKGAGMTRVHNIVSVDSVGNAYVSSFSGYKSLDSESYLTASDRVGFQSCCSISPCNQKYGQVAASGAMGYSAKLYDGFVEQSMTSSPGPYPHTDYRTFAKSSGMGNELSSGVSFSSSTASGSLKQNYEKHITVTGQFSVYNTAETQ